MLLSLVSLGVLRGINVLVPLYNKYIGKCIPYSKGSIWRQAIVLLSLVLLGVLRGINVRYLSITNILVSVSFILKAVYGDRQLCCLASCYWGS